VDLLHHLPPIIPQGHQQEADDEPNPRQERPDESVRIQNALNGDPLAIEEVYREQSGNKRGVTRKKGYGDSP